MVAQASKLVYSTTPILITNTGIIAKQSENELLVWLTKLETGKPQNKCSVIISSRNKTIKKQSDNKVLR